MPRQYKISQSKELLKNGRKKPMVKKKPKKKLADPYDFDGWFDALNADPSKGILLTKGKDFPCMSNSMVVQLRNAAANYGIKIHLNVEDENHIVMSKRQVFGAK